MAVFPVEILNFDKTHRDYLEKAVYEGNQAQSLFSFSILPDSFSQTMRLDILSNTHTGTFFSSLERKKEEWRGFHPAIIAFLETPIQSDKWSNLFSSRCVKSGLAIVTSAGVSNLLIQKDKMSAYFLYELATHVLALIAGGRKHHLDQLNCIFDFKQDKSGILDSIKTGSLCDVCRVWFRENGRNVSSEQLEALILLFRKSSDLIGEQTSPVIPRIFIGSSMEGLNIARAIQAELEHDYSVEIWNQQTVFHLGVTTIGGLEQAPRQYSYGIFVFTPDDKIQLRGNNSSIPRDNVIFEAGLFVGALGIRRTFIVHPRNSSVQLPSDLLGLTTATFNPDTPNIRAAIGSACNQIRTAIQNCN